MNIQIYDPALCCSTGVCSIDVDQALVSFAADVEWARQNGARVERFDLAQQPQAFAGNALVKALLEQYGQEGLPLVLVNGQQLLAGRYPGRDELAAWMKADADTTLFTPEVSELVAIGAAIASHCEPCFKYHYDVARKLGVSHADLQRAVDLAQKIKDTSAQAMLELVRRYISPDLPVETGAASTSPAPKACCGATSKPAESAKGTCC